MNWLARPLVVGVAICTARPELVPATLAGNQLTTAFDSAPPAPGMAPAGSAGALPVVVFAGAAGGAVGSLRTESHPFAAPASWDLWRRRNVALATARALGWDALLLLDDDIRGLTAADIRGAIYALERGAAIASWRIEREIDTSCVGHCSIALGHEEQPPLASGACMMVRLVGPGSERISHFPPVYNEDLLFAREATLEPGTGRPGSTEAGGYNARVIGTVEQLAQADRFDLERAKSQEFGEVLCEALAYGRRAGAADRHYRDEKRLHIWRWALERRREELQRLLAEAEQVPKLPKRFRADDKRAIQAAIDVHIRGRAEAALRVALEQHAKITPEHLRSFYEAWRADVEEQRAPADPLVVDSVPAPR